MKIYSVLLFIATLAISLQAANSFDKYFHDKTMRIDYYHSGNAHQEVRILKDILTKSLFRTDENKGIGPVPASYSLQDRI